MGVAGWALSLIGITSALTGIFVLGGISIELPGIMLGGGLGYYFGLRAQERTGQILGILAIVNVVSIFVSGLEEPAQ